MLTKLFAALMTVMLCLGIVPVSSTQTEQAVPAKHLKVIEANAEIPPSSEAVIITAEEAKAIALECAGLTPEACTFSRTEFDWDDGRPEWEVEFRSGDWEYDCTIHAETGKILDWDKEYDPKKIAPTQPPATEPPVTEPPVTQTPSEKLTKEDAQAIALAHAGLTADEVTRLRTEYDRDDGVPEYHIEFRVGRWDYEYEIHAETGKILDWEKDYDD